MADDFGRRAAAALAALERAVSEVDGVEADLGGDVLTVEVGGRTCVVNSHGTAKQIWLAANARAWHFDFQEPTGRWIDTREGRELWTVLSEVVSFGLGREVRLVAPA